MLSAGSLVWPMGGTLSLAMAFFLSPASSSVVNRFST